MIPVTCNRYTLQNLVTIETKCKELDEYHWIQSLPQTPKIRTYIEYKQTFDTEEYVKYCFSRRRQSLIAQTSIGILPFHIVTGRIRNVKLENRTCQVCKNNDLKMYFILSVFLMYTLHNGKQCTPRLTLLNLLI